LISVVHLGTLDYGSALRLQEHLVELRKQGRIGNTLLLLEHPPVITLGRNANETNIVVSREVLAKKGVEVFEINRGGDVTFHGPGQLVGYPIFDLRSFPEKVGVIEYVRRMEEALIRTCIHYGIETQRIAGMTGVWTKAEPPVVEARNSKLETSFSERKIAAIGVHISRGVTSHGFALNVTTNLDYFKLIVPCGLTKPVTSIEFETGEQPSLEDVANLASRSFGEIFQSQILWLDSIHDLIPEEGDPTNPQDTPNQEPLELRGIRGDGDRLV
jgi:lipoyl(octanoyl) transferase